MRLMLILTTIVTQLFLANISWADTYEDCKASCKTDKETRDVDCPSPYDSSTENREREQCMKTSREMYDSCLAGCPSPQTPSPESNTSPMNY